jgi:hypothetical protein
MERPKHLKRGYFATNKAENEIVQGEIDHQLKIHADADGSIMMLQTAA